MSLTASLEDKIQWLARIIKTTLDAHGYGSFKVETFVREFMLKIDTNTDIGLLMGSPIRYARIWFDGVDIQPRNQSNPITVYGGYAKVSHRLGVLIEFQFVDAAAEEDSSDLQFRNLLEREEEGEAQGLLSYLRNLGGALVLSECTAELSGPENIGLPSYPIHSSGGGDSFIHYVEFTLTIT